MGQWFWVVVVERFLRQSRQIWWVQGRVFGRVSEDQQTMQVGLSSSSSSSSLLLEGKEDVVGSVDDCSMGGCSVVDCSVASGCLASGSVFMNLSKLGRLPAAFACASGSLLQVKAKTVKASASVH